jgi:hypothetical protein
MRTLNEAFSTLSMRRRYEVWFLRLGLADGSGGWWFRYLLTNPGRGGCSGSLQAMPVQVWATWFPRGGKPQSFIQGFPLHGVEFSGKGNTPFHFAIQNNAIDEDSCRGALALDGHDLCWNLRYRSTFRTTLSSKGWIGFSRTPHSDAVFSGEITFDGQKFTGNPLGFGVQGHNCGYRHRNFWAWTHAYFASENRPATTIESLTYEMPLGLTFRKVVLWHDQREYVLRSIREMEHASDEMLWAFDCSGAGLRLHASIDGRGVSAHRLPYVKTNCTGTFEVTNNSLASAFLVIERDGTPTETLSTESGAVLEVVG